MKKVVIIGAGIAGLTCGIYAQKNGFETEIYEQHTIPGGECTGWDRGGYHFDGCLHWLVGSKPGTQSTRPHCPYPQEAAYDGQGNVDDAQSYSCATPG